MPSLKNVKNFFRISIALLLLVVCIGSIYAADDSQITLNENGEASDFELDEEFDVLSDDDIDDDLDDEGDGDLDDNLDEEDDDDDSEDEFDDDEDDDSEDEFDDDEDLDDELDDDEDYDYNYTDFDYLKQKIIYYLDKYGNCSSDDWTESDDFLNEYQMYLLNPDNYTLDENAEGYKTYLKIYESITSTFGDYNLTENETAYLKFMVIFFLNHYGNVSANYTWNESESFENFTMPCMVLGAACDALAQGTATSPLYANTFIKLYDAVNDLITNSTDVNNTSAADNQMPVAAENSWDFGIAFLVVMLLIVVLVII